MSIRRIVDDLIALKSHYSGINLDRIQIAIDSLNRVETSSSQMSRRSAPYQYESSRPSYHEHGLMGAPAPYQRAGCDTDYINFNNDRTYNGCPDCQPGRPCYGHGH